MLYYWAPFDKEDLEHKFYTYNFVYSLVLLDDISIDFTYGRGNVHAYFQEDSQKEVFNEDWERINSRIKVINK